MKITQLTARVRRFGSRLSIANEIAPDLRRQVQTQSKTASPTEIATLRERINTRAEAGVAVAATCMLFSAVLALFQPLLCLMLAFGGMLSLGYAGAWHLVAEEASDGQ
ncbi:hypothetical protein DNK10_06660 [Pseudomonas daroniae]|nr:hypothetical protein DNK10_06660 [Pseudomonas daroniae]